MDIANYRPFADFRASCHRDVAFLARYMRIRLTSEKTQSTQLASSPTIGLRKLSLNFQVSTDSVLSSPQSLSDKPQSPPNSLKPTPDSWVESASEHGGSKSSSRTTSSELPSPTSDQSGSQIKESVSYAVAEIVSLEFSLVSLHNALTRLGWVQISLPQGSIESRSCGLVQ